MAACIASCGGDDTCQSLDRESSWLHHETTSCSNANTYQHQVQVILLLAALGDDILTILPPLGVSIHLHTIPKRIS